MPSFPQHHIGTIPSLVPSPSPAIGYTTSHMFHAQQHNKIMALAASPQCQVTICIALHYLKEEGKSGTELIGVSNCILIFIIIYISYRILSKIFTFP